MKDDIDEDFYSRADEHINLSNQQIEMVGGRGKVSASMMYGTARFNAWVSACGFSSGEEMAELKEKTIEYFCQQYRSMLEKNVDDYIKNFNVYMKPPH